MGKKSTNVETSKVSPGEGNVIKKSPLKDQLKSGSISTKGD